MKAFVCIAVSIMFCLHLTAQEKKANNSIVGKWKLIAFSKGEGAIIDIKADTFYITDSSKAFWKKGFYDEKAMTSLKKLMKEARETEDEFLLNNIYIERNEQTGKVKNGTYSFNTTNNTLKRKLEGKSEENFLVSWKGKSLVLTIDRGDKQKNVILTYERQ